jgi:hypothetical protein
MAISTPSVLDTTTNTSAVTTITSGSISPTANALLVVMASMESGDDPGAYDYNTNGIDDSLTGTGTWTKHEDIAQDPGNNIRVAIWTAQAGGSPGSGTITVGRQFSTTSRNTIHVVEIATGFDTTTPVPQSKSVGDGGAGASTYSVTLDSTPASDSCLFGFIVIEDDTDADVTAGTGYTELADTNTTGSHDIQQQCQYDLTAPSDGICDWSSTTGDQMLAAAIEVQAAAAGNAMPMAMMHYKKMRA